MTDQPQTLHALLFAGDKPGLEHAVIGDRCKTFSCSLASIHPISDAGRLVLGRVELDREPVDALAYHARHSAAAEAVKQSLTNAPAGMVLVPRELLVTLTVHIPVDETELYCDTCELLAAAPAAQVAVSADRDAYEGAREDLLDWKRRAQRAEAELRRIGYTGITPDHPPAAAPAAQVAEQDGMWSGSIQRGVQEALQRMIEDAFVRGLASVEDGRLVQQWAEKINVAAPAVVVDEAMVERALKGVWPLREYTEYQRNFMRAAISAALQGVG